MDGERLERLFDEALGIPPERRAAWLDAACADDPPLRGRLQRLLDADARAAGVLEDGRGLIDDVLACAAEMPQRFGVWRTIRPLGAGGMGDVWLGERDDAGFVQRAAIKQVAWPTPGLLQRFRRERQILARLEHPGIARLIDGGVDDAGCPYLVMEYVEGTPIAAWVRDRGLGVRDTVELLLRVCDSVQFAHRNLVVHSDIKPSNLLVDDEGTPKLLDFGIARVLAEDGEAAGTVARLMTPDYAAPELLAGGAITTSVDVYALGVLAYELLAGCKPYRLAPSDAGTAFPVARPPSTRAASRSRRRGLHGDLDRIVMAAMAPQPAQRYASVDALSADLRRWLEGRAISLRGGSAWYRMRRFVQRNRVPVAAAACVLVVLSGATAYSLHQASVANLQAARAQQQAARADAVREFLDSTLTQIDPAANRGETVGMRELLERSERRLARAKGMPLAVRVDLTTLVGKLYWNLADNVATERVLEQAVALAQTGDVPAAVRARAWLALATVESDRGDNGQAYDHARRAYTLASAAATGDDPELETLVASAQRLVASLSIEHDGAAQAEPVLRRLLASDQAHHGDSQAVVDDHIMLGQALDTLGRYEAAETHLESAVAIARRLQGPTLSSLALSSDILGVVRTHRGDYVGASTAFIEAGKVTAMLWGRDNVRTSITREQLLEVAVLEGRFQASLPAALAMRDEAAGMRDARPDHYASSSRLVADALLGLGRLEEAEGEYRGTLESWRRVPEGERSAGMARTWAGLATTLMLEGRLAEAEAAVHEAIGIDRGAVAATAPVSPTLPALGRDLAILSQLARLRGSSVDALRDARAAVAALPDLPESASPGQALARASLAEALLADGQADAALAQARRALDMGDLVLPDGNWQRTPLLLALARAELAAGQPGRAEALLGQAWPLHAAALPAGDPRRLQLQSLLLRAFAAQGKQADAASLRSRLLPRLEASPPAYRALFRQHLPPG